VVVSLDYTGQSSVSRHAVAESRLALKSIFTGLALRGLGRT